MRGDACGIRHWARCRRRTRKPRHLRVRRSEISGRLRAFRLCQSESPEGRSVFTDRRRRRLDVQFVQCLHRQGRCGEQHGPDIRIVDDARAGRAGRGLSVRGRPINGVRRRHAISLSSASRNHVSRRHADHRGGRGVFAADIEDKRPPQSVIGAEHVDGDDCGGRVVGGAALRAGTRARRPRARRGDADFFGEILCDARLR